MSTGMISRRQFGQLALGAGVVAASSMAGLNSAVAEDAGRQIDAAKLLFLHGEDQVWAFANIDKLYATRTIPAGGKTYPLAEPRAEYSLNFQHDGRAWDIGSFVQENRVAALVVIKDKQIIAERYSLGHSAQGKWTSFSAGKSVVSTLIGAAIQDGHIASVLDPVSKYLPVLKESAFGDATIRDLLRMSGGEAWNENYMEPDADINKQLAIIAERNRPGALLKYMAALGRASPTGMYNDYRTGESYLLGEIVAAAVGQNLSTYLSERIWKPFGMESDAYWMLTAENSIEFGGGCISATARDYARFGQFMLDGGVAGGRQVLPQGWIAEATAPSAPMTKQGAPAGYGYQWWATKSAAYGAEGVFGQIIHIDPARKIVIAMHEAWPEAWPDKNANLTDAFIDAVSADLG